MEHSFNIEIAQKYGIKEAIMLNNLYFWIEKNKANNKHIYDGHVWTYNSCKAFSNLFPYLTEKQIRNTLDNLLKEDLIIKGNYNKLSYDRTLWYAITDKGYSILQNGQMDLPQKANGSAENVKPIPDINTNKNNICSSLAEDFNKLWKIYPRKDGKNQAFNHYKAWINGKSYAGKTEKLTNPEMWYAIRIYQCNIKKNKTEKQYIKMGSTFFNEAIYEYASYYRENPQGWEKKIKEILENE